MTVRARSPRTGIAQFKWVLLQGDPKKVQIKELDANGAQVEIKVGWHGWYRPVYADGSPAALMSSRVDIACFIKGDKYYSAPSVISVYCDPAEQRLYSSDGRIVSIDYANPNKHYTDPALAVLKPWKDLFDYTENNELKGWYRKLGDRSARFTYAGHRVLSTDKLDRPLTACAVDYLPRETSGSTGLPVMTFADSSRQFKYLYKSESDLIGTFELLRH